jgi:hypothetical protein
MSDFISFDEFLDRTAAARADHLLKSLQAHYQYAIPDRKGIKPPKLEDFEPEFDRMKKYILSRYQGAKAEHTFVDGNGNFIDCIPFEQQSTVRTALAEGLKVTRKPPEPPGLALRLIDPMKRPPVPTPIVAPLRRGLIDPFGHPIACPDGLVPVRRITLSVMSRFGTFDRFFQKAPMQAGKATSKKKRASATRPTKKKPPRRRTPIPLAVGEHRYAVCEDTHGGPYYGCATGLNVWAPRPAPGVFSLSQLWLVGSTMGNGRPETIESGWIVYPGLGGLGDYPGLFVYYNPDGYAGGGGYVENQAHHGFIPFADSGWTLMSGMTNVSTPGPANQTGLMMLWAVQDGDQPPQTRGWYLYLGQDKSHFDKVGYFPLVRYSGVLTQSANDVQFGGEVAPYAGGTSTGQMGSGQKPASDASSSYGQAAFQFNSYVWTQQDQNMAPASLREYHTDRPYYDLTLSDNSQFSGYFFFGGPSAP